MDIQSPNIRIHDLSLAAALMSAGYKLIGTNRDRNGRFYFMFKQTDRLTNAMDAYWADTLIVKARMFGDNTKMLKGRIYSEQ
ncbi:hypothetical protein KC968_04300 [Candidatus Saccharibacteria bacterium]|nr:hypothetical protein [Candidatus Saccharibacteria bacterium]